MDLPYTSEVLAIRTFFLFLLANSSTPSVPLTLVSIVRTGLSTMSRTPTEAARWKTASQSSISSASNGRLKIESMT